MTQMKVREKTSIDNIETKMFQTCLKKKNNYVSLAVVCLVVFALVITGAVIGVYVGRHMKQDIYKESWATYHNTRTGDTIKQRYIVDGREVLIVKPGEMSIIYDYGKYHVVMQFDGMRHKASNDCVCFVSDLDEKERISLDDLVNYLKIKDIFESGSFLTIHTKIFITNTTVNTAELSKRSQELCHGCVNLQAVISREFEDDTTPRRRRQTNEQMCTRWYCVQTTDGLMCTLVTIDSEDNLGCGGTPWGWWF